jgi:enoyl-CoA hydratase
VRTDDDVSTSVGGGIGRITLERPKAMNALTTPMVARIQDSLDAWDTDDAVRVVVIDGAGERGLCAGGDIKMFHASARGDGSEARAFFRAEYRMNATIARYRKPVVALQFGAVFGGGVGISSHARHRLVAQGASVGMPEVGIGFVPDVGGTWLLGRTPGQLGIYLALTGLPANAADAVLCGLSDAVVTAADLDAVRAAADEHAVLDVVARAGGPAPGGVLAGRRPWIDACFTAPTARQILDRLRRTDDADALATADLIATRSPEAVELTLLAIRRARTLPRLEDALAMEFGIASASLRRHDFVEGIRAQVIDKDRRPQWRPAGLDGVDLPALAAMIDATPG